MDASTEQHKQPLSVQELPLGTPQAPTPSPVPPSQPVVPPQTQGHPVAPKASVNLLPVLLVIVLILILAAGGGAYLYITDSGYPLSIDDQPVTDVIHINKLTLEKEGFLVISLINFSAGHFRVASTVRLTPDTYTDFDLEVTNFSEDVQLRPGAKLFGTVVYDTNRNGQIDEEEELAPAVKDGKPIRREFKILAR